jgi:hypothetical protein
MKAWHFLQVSSEIIRKHCHRSDVTRMTSSTDLQIAVTSTTNESNVPSYLLDHSEVQTKRLRFPAQLPRPITEHESEQFNQYCGSGTGRDAPACRILISSGSGT